MFTVDDIIFSGITDLAINQARSEKLKSNNFIIPKEIFKIAGTESAIFYLDENVDTIREVMTEYNFYDLRPTDNVLDIGACIGAFTLNVYNKVNHVYAVEPLMTDILQKNISLNNARNITILDCALGSGEINVQWNGISKTVKALSLEDIMNLCNDKIDFIKCDCEGGEWCVSLSEIYNIRRIEAEIHNFGNIYKINNAAVASNYRFKDFENLLISSGFDFSQRMTNRGTMLISAKNRYIK